ncbi:hypothetical protein ACFL9T_04980 [Thermodesulfobacteriota bacterium]
MPHRKKKYYKITAVMLSILVLGIGLTPSFAECKSMTSCCKISEKHGSSRLPMKLKISEERDCSCGPESTCDDISTGGDIEAFDCLLVSGGRPSHSSYPLFAANVSTHQSSYEAHKSRFRGLLAMGKYSTDPLYLENLTLLF